MLLCRMVGNACFPCGAKRPLLHAAVHRRERTIRGPSRRDKRAAGRVSFLRGGDGMTRKKRRALLCMLAVPLLALAPRSEESLPASAAEPAAVPEKMWR